MSDPGRGGLTLSALQRIILQMYGEKDAARGDAATFLWLTEEFGELATALAPGTQDELAAEMADVLAWLATLANIRGDRTGGSRAAQVSAALARAARPSRASATRPRNLEPVGARRSTADGLNPLPTVAAPRNRTTERDGSNNHWSAPYRK